MLTVHIIGTGPGSSELLTKSAEKALNEATIVVGDTRLLSEMTEGKRCIQTYKVDEIRQIVLEADKEKDCLAVLVSGDVGFYSLAKILADIPGCRIVRHPGISSLVYFAARTSMSWDDMYLMSRHGRDGNLTGAVMTHKKVFCLTGGKGGSVRDLCEELCRNGLGQVKVTVGERLSYEEERICTLTASEGAKEVFDPLAVMVVENEEAQPVITPVHGWDDSLFLRGKAPMTKQEVRALAISKLRPEADHIVYDIGTGTGSCSVELAFQVPYGKVYGFEINKEAASLAEANKERFNACNLEIIRGNALEKIVNMPCPDRVFIGGTKGNLKEILDILYKKNAYCRIVITAITLETAGAVTAYYKEHTDYELETTQLFASEGRRVGPYTLMEGHNPVYVMTAYRKEAEYEGQSK